MTHPILDLDGEMGGGGVQGGKSEQVPSSF